MVPVSIQNEPENELFFLMAIVFNGSHCWAKASPVSFHVLWNGCQKMDDAVKAGPEGDGVMTWMRTAMAGPRRRSKRAHGTKIRTMREGDGQRNTRMPHDLQL